MTDEIEIHLNQFCPNSQRILITLIECNINYKKHIYADNGTPLPKWLLKISPQGYLPVLNDNDEIIIGSDAISVHLEKYPKVLKLVPKKRHCSALVHCKTQFEPIFEQLSDPVNANAVTILTKLLYHEMELLDSAIKGPYYLGNSLSLIDIYYWTILQQLLLLEYMYHIKLPLTCTNIKNWMERLGKRDSFQKASYEKRSYISWFEGLRGRGNIRPATSPIEFTQIINNALRRGVEDSYILAKNLDFNDNASIQVLAQKLHAFDLVLREHSYLKMELLVKSFIEKNHKIPDSLIESFDKQKQTLNIIKSYISKITLHNALNEQLTEKKNDKLIYPILEWKLAKLEKFYSKNVIKKQLETTLEKFNHSLCEDLCEEENILSLEVSQAIFTKYELYNLNRQIALFHPAPILQIHIPWVISNLMDPTQIRTFVLYNRFVMPFRFIEDTINWLKVGLSEQLWNDVRRIIEKIKKTETLQSDSKNAPPVPPRKKTTNQIPSLPSATAKQAIIYANRNMANDSFISSNPLTVFDLITTVLKEKLQSIQQICVSSISLVSINTLEHSLSTIFRFLIVKHHQEQYVLFPILKRKSSKMHLLLSSLMTDKIVAEKQRLKVYSIITQARMGKGSSDISRSELIHEILLSLSLEIHNLYKLKQFYTRLYELFSFTEQAALIREILDHSPLSFIDTMIPWILKLMSSDKQAIFIMSMKQILVEEVFQKLLLPIRKVLPVSLCNTLLTKHSSRKSM